MTKRSGLCRSANCVCFGLSNSSGVAPMTQGKQWSFDEPSHENGSSVWKIAVCLQPDWIIIIGLYGISFRHHRDFSGRVLLAPASSRGAVGRQSTSKRRLGRLFGLLSNLRSRFQETTSINTAVGSRSTGLFSGRCRPLAHYSITPRIVGL